MRQRCRNPKHTFYRDYGERGIQVEKAWDDFDRFCADVGERPEGCTLDRIKDHYNYGPGKTKWSTSTEQNGNRRNCRFIKVGGKKVHMAEVARQNDISQSTLRDRLDRGLTLQAALAG